MDYSTFDIKRALKETGQRQARAADPQSSVWVSANAGTGKTHVLTMRTLRLLLAGTDPKRILCLTYTKAAAAEMSARVFDALAKWVSASDHDLKENLKDLLKRSPSEEEIERARTLFAYTIETPGGLKVQTIHAFCERLLQRFPLEAGVTPGFSILDDDMVRTLKREAIDAVLQRATSDPEGAYGIALSTVVAFASDDRFDELLSSAISERSFLESVVFFEGEGVQEDGLPQNIEQLLRETVGVRASIKLSEINEELCSVLSDDDIKRLAEVLSTGGKRDNELCLTLRELISRAPGSSKVAGLSGFFLTAKDEPRSRLMSKGLEKEHPDLYLRATKAQETFTSLKAEHNGLQAIEATLALITLSRAVLQEYTDAKARRAGLDYEDLIEKSGKLLASGDNADWVLYKLDGGLDHILVDESQDTSPMQWKIIEALAREFFSGVGAREDVRTMFAVGDEKQSIYSFQGAAPEQFSKMGKRFETLCLASKQPWRRVPLNLSFRTVPPVLQAVDLVFGDRTATPGLGESGEDINHIAARHGRAGLVEVWPTISSQETEKDDVWLPGDEARYLAPAQILADQIGDTIQRWLKDGELLVSEDRPIRESDILILVRKRQPFAGPMVRALKARGIAVAGSDRVDLMSQIAVMDLVALGDFLVLPEDDLALACVLKSPMFGFEDDDLFRIANGRRGTLWKALLDARELGGLYESAMRTLLQWRKRADFLPPFEFYSDILDAGGMRCKMLSRLGSEACEPLDEFLNLMINFDEGAPPSLSGFLSWLRSGKREIKRDMEQGSGEVRVMTVHGSKGLEAPIVFLPDTCTTASGGGNLGGFVKVSAPRLPSSFSDLMMWKVKGSGSIDAFSRAAKLKSKAERDELNRLLYVAMTRARDRLYICGFEGNKGRSKGCWFDIISSALEPMAENVTTEDGRQILRIRAPQTHHTPDRPKHSALEKQVAKSLPLWATSAAPVELELSVPLAPSKLAPYDIDEEGEPLSPEPDGLRDGKRLPAEGSQLEMTIDDKPIQAEGGKFIKAPLEPLEPAVQPLRSLSDERKFLRGTLTHALLEHLPTLEREVWDKAANAYIKTRGAALASKVRQSIVKETLAILSDGAFGALFGKNSQAEVAIGAEIPSADGSGPPLRLSGMIDRLAVLDEEVLIVDYKTNRPPPKLVENVPDAYLFQLAAYRLALLDIYPKKAVRAAILWTQSAQLMEIPDSTLVQYGSQLWDLAADRS